MPLPPEFMDWIVSFGLLAVIIGAVLYLLWIFTPALRDSLQENVKYTKAGQSEQNAELCKTMTDLLEEMKMLRKDIEELRRELRE